MMLRLPLPREALGPSKKVGESLVLSIECVIQEEWNRLRKMLLNAENCLKNGCKPHFEPAITA